MALPGSRPLWQHWLLRHLPGGLEGNAHAEVVVIGAGLTGLTVALHLARAGREVLVLDDGPAAGGETFRTTAHLSNALDDLFIEMERLHGVDAIRLAVDGHTAALDWIERFVAEEGIRCDFRRVDGYLFNAPENPGAVDLTAEVEAARRAGLVDAELVLAPPVPTLAAGPALRYQRQAQMHPLRYVAGLAAAAWRAGARLQAPTHIEEVRGGKRPEVVARNGAVVTCDQVVVATHAPINDRLLLAPKMTAQRTYVIAAPVPAGSVPVALYWDTLRPYHYVRVAPGRGADWLVVGGEDHRTGQADDAALRYARLEAWARARFPQLGPVESRWSGQVLEPADGLAYIGRHPSEENVLVATGDSGHGITHATIAGGLLTDLIQGRPNPSAGLFDPARLAPGAAASVVAEGAAEIARYADWLTPGDTTPAQLERNEGAVVRDGLVKVAVYRDSQRQLHACSAVCPHLGGVVRWNGGERSFDCPVHGSRFDRRGHVINGPSPRDLKPLPGWPGTKPVD